MRFALPAAIAVSIGLLAPAQADTVCDNPALIIKPDSPVLMMHQIFNAGAASSRVFNEVHYDTDDPNLTVGMGHWVGGKLAGLFHWLQNKDDVWELLTTNWAGAMNSAQWRAFERQSGATGRNAEAISQGLSRLLCAKDPSSSCVNGRLLPWSHRVRTRFNNKDQWFHAGWLAVSRLKPIAEEQVRYWAASVLDKGQQNAGARGIETKGGIATVISATSSGLGTTMFPIGVNTATATFTKKVNNRTVIETHSWRLNRVPRRAQPPAGALDEEALQQDWRSYVAWAYYSFSKGRVRSRMREIWRIFYEPTWGPMPATRRDIKNKIPRHTGCYMAQGDFDFANPVQIPSDLNCKAKVPSPRQMACIKKP